MCGMCACALCTCIPGFVLFFDIKKVVMMRSAHYLDIWFVVRLSQNKNDFPGFSVVSVWAWA